MQPAIEAWAINQIEPDPGNDGIGLLGCKVTSPLGTKRTMSMAKFTPRKLRNLAVENSLVECGYHFKTRSRSYSGSSAYRTDSDLIFIGKNAPFLPLKSGVQISTSCHYVRHKTITGFPVPLYPQVRLLLQYLCEGRADNERVFKIADAKKALGGISFANLPLAADDVLVSH